MSLINLICFISLLVLLPFVSIGLIRKVKARFQNRVGPPIFQALFNTIKLLRKTETVSQETSWIFRASALINFAVVLILAFLVPWSPIHFNMGINDIFLIIYLFALYRFFTVIGSLDGGSAFSTFGASREITLGILIEPSIVLSIVALGVYAHTSNLNQIFLHSGQPRHFTDVLLWMFAGAGLFLSSLVELSRMPIDDPTTHLELTMVHEAMILENSGPNFALIEMAYILRLVILYGLAAQCFLHGMMHFVELNFVGMFILSILLILTLAVLTAIIESFAVKLAWRNNPNFIAYSLTMSLLASLSAIVVGVIG